MCVLFFFYVLCLHKCTYAFKFKVRVNCGSALGPGASGLPFHCTPPVTVPDVIGGPAVWRHNNKKTGKKKPLARSMRKEGIQGLRVYLWLSMCHCGVCVSVPLSVCHCRPRWPTEMWRNAVYAASTVGGVDSGGEDCEPSMADHSLPSILVLCLGVFGQKRDIIYIK